MERKNMLLPRESLENSVTNDKFSFFFALVTEHLALIQIKKNRKVGQGPR